MKAKTLNLTMSAVRPICLFNFGRHSRPIALWLILGCLAAACADNPSRERMLPPLPNEQNMQLTRQIAYLSEQLSGNERNPQYFFERARLLAAAGRFTSAAQDIQYAIQLESNRAEFFLLQAWVFRNNEQYKTALEAAEQAATMGMSQASLTFLLGELLYMNNKDSLALPYLLQSAQADFETHLALFYLGRLANARNDTASAHSYFEQVLAHQPDYLPALKAWTSNYSKAGWHPKVLALYEQYLPQASPKDAELAFYLGEALKASGKADSAEVWYRQAVALDNRHWPAHMELGRMAQKKWQLEDAEQYFLKALAVKPDIENGYQDLGYLYEYYLRNYDQALSAYLKGFQIDSTNVKLQWYANRVERKIAGIFNVPNPAEQQSEQE